jgi:5-methylcytosine-specific restriction enzyme subunit McrC
MIQLQEHDRIEGVDTQNQRFENLSLVSWDKPQDGSSWGYYASYKIGAEWIDDKEALVVTAKRGMEKIDFLSMFMTCFSSNLAIESFAKIYSINAEQPSIETNSLKGVVSPLIVLHYLGVVSRIKTLKKGYIHRRDNLKKVKGRIDILRNERTNIALKRYDRICCNYDEYSVDIPENRLLKKALLFSKRIVDRIGEHHSSYNNIKQMLARCMSMFENVGDDVDIRDVRQIKEHKLFRDYAEAIRLAKLVLSHFDYSINKTSEANNKIVPFVLDMSLLYEHYVYGLLYQAYKNKITYQNKGETGKPDFLYSSESYKAILDTKYIPKYKSGSLDNYVVRQLSGYSRDVPILRSLGYDIVESSPTPSVPCIIIYPNGTGVNQNPFLGKSLIKVCTKNVRNLSQFYKIAIPIPIIE